MGQLVDLGREIDPPRNSGEKNDIISKQVDTKRFGFSINLFVYKNDFNSL